MFLSKSASPSFGKINSMKRSKTMAASFVSARASSRISPLRTRVGFSLLSLCAIRSLKQATSWVKTGLGVVVSVAILPGCILVNTLLSAARCISDKHT